MLVHALLSNCRKMLARDVFDTFVTHAGLVHDVSDTDCCARRTHSRVFATSNRLFCTNRTKNGVKNCCVYSSSSFFCC